MVADRAWRNGFRVAHQQPLRGLLRRIREREDLVRRPRPVYVYQQAFDSCIGIGSTAARTVNMRLIDTNGNNLRIRLTN